MMCPNCGVENPDYSFFCASCAQELPGGSRSGRTDRVANVQDAQSRYCVSCGRRIGWDANVCPYCGHYYRYHAPYQSVPVQPEISDGMKIVFYILSLLFWIARIIIGAIYVSKPNPESKNVGKMCIILACISIVITIVGTLVIYDVILGFGGY